jgi:hypothetical protein
MDEFGRQYRNVIYQLPPPERETPPCFERLLAEDLERVGPGKWMRSTSQGELFPNYCYAARIPFPCSAEAAEEFLERIEAHVDAFLARVQRQIAA